MEKNIFLFSLVFIIIPTILFGADDSPTNKNPQPDATEYLTNGKYYTPEGRIHFVGSLIGNELTIFFKTLTTDDNLYFKISYCLENLEATCSNGITICYDSMLAKYPQFKNVKLKKMDEIKCDKATDFGFHVYTEEVDGMAKYFVLKTSLDKHYYRFEIPDPISQNDPKRCFELRMGSQDSIATTITDVNGKNLIYTGGPPKKFEPDNPLTLFNVENPNTMNLWLLFLDFMPYYPPQLSFLPRPFVIKGGNKNCKMTAEFDDENINVCKQDREYIGGCETKFLNSSDLECQAELRVSESVEKERGSQETNTDTDGRKKHSQHQFEVGGEIGAEGGWNLFATAKIETKIKSNYAYTWGGENYWEKSSAMTKISALREVEESGKTINMNVHRTDGGPVSFYQSVLKCCGMTFRYHKIYAEGDKEHESGPQSTVAYQVLDGQALPLNNQPIDVYFNYNINPKSPKNVKGKRLPGDKIYV